MSPIIMPPIIVPLMFDDVLLMFMLLLMLSVHSRLLLPIIVSSPRHMRNRYPEHRRALVSRGALVLYNHCMWSVHLCYRLCCPRNLEIRALMFADLRTFCFAGVHGA